MWVQLSDRRLDDDLLGTVGVRIVLHVAIWQRSTRSILAASILAADRAKLAGQPEKPERQKQASLEVDCFILETIDQLPDAARGEQDP